MKRIGDMRLQEAQLYFALCERDEARRIARALYTILIEVESVDHWHEIGPSAWYGIRMAARKARNAVGNER